MAESAISFTTNFIQQMEEAGYGTLAQTFRLIFQEFPEKASEFSIGRVQGWIDELVSGKRADGRDGRDEDQIRDDIFKHIVTAEDLMAQYGIDEDQAQRIIVGGNDGGINFGEFLDLVGEGGDGTTVAPPDDVSGPPGAAGVSEGFPGVMPGGTLVQIERAGQDDLFIQAYEWPPGSGEFVSWVYSGAEQLEQVFGPDWALRQPRRIEDEDWYRENVVLGDDIGEIIGVEIEFQTMFGNVVDEVARASGISDPTLLGQMANDPDIQRLIAMNAIGDWSSERLMGEIRNTSFWTEVLYPGIDTLYATGTTDPEREWLIYQQRMESVYRAMGIQPGADGSYRSMVGEDLALGIDPDLADEMVPTFQRAANSPGYAAVLDQWMQRDLGVELDFDTWFDVLAGQAPPDVQQVVEQATLEFAANQASLGLSTADIQRIAESSDLSEAQAKVAFEEVSDVLLGLGDEGLKRYGLTQDDILSQKTGIEATSGRSNAEIKQLARKTLTELGLADDRKINLYVGYDPSRGTPTRPGLGALAPQGA